MIPLAARISAAAVALLISVSALAETRSGNPYPESSPLHRPFGIFLDRMLALPELNAQLERVDDVEQAFEIGMTLSESGMRKLDTSALEERMRIIARVIERTDVVGCALLVRGERGEAQKGAEVLSAALAELDAQTINDWFDLAFKAMLAELRDAPVPTFDEAGIEDAMRALIAILPSDEADRFADALGSLPEGSDEEVCWAGKTLYRAALKLEAPHRAVLARALAME